MRCLTVIFLVAGFLASPASADVDPRLSVSGGDADLRSALAAAAASLDAPEPDQTAQDILAAARADYARLLDALYDAGYFAATVSIRVNGQEAGGLSPFAAPDPITSVAIRVDPGPRFTFGRAEIAPLAPMTDVTDAFRPGAPARVPVLRAAAEDAIDGWRDRGHAAARIYDQRLTARHPDAVLDADIRVAPGPRLTFGRVIPSGQARMPADRVAEIAGLPIGTVFHPDEVDRAAERLRRTGVFSSVALTERPPNPDGTLDIAATVVEAPLRRIGAGVEVSNIDGLSLTGYWLHRNLTGGGERLRLDFGITGIGQADGAPDVEFGVSLSRPATATPDTTFEASLATGYEDEETYQAFTVEGAVGVEQYLRDDLRGQAAISLAYADVSNNFGDYDLVTLGLPIGLTLDRRDDMLDPTAGVYAAAMVTPFYITDRSTSGLRATLDARGYVTPFDATGTTLAGRLQLGTLAGVTQRQASPDALFYSGGGGTVRGQDHRSLGAVVDGRQTGGRGFLSLSGELRQDIGERFGVVAFYDAGYVSPGALWDDSGDWHAGAGLGLRYNTAIGSIRVDLAAPVERISGASDIYLYVGIGQSF